MKTFTSTQLRIKTGDVLNEVTKRGLANISHRDRPEMVLIEKTYLDNALLDDSIKSALIADLIF